MVIDHKQLIEALGDAIIVADSSGVIRLWSPAAERIFGFSQTEAIGYSLDLIIPERSRDRHWVGYAKTMATGQTRFAHDVLRAPAVHKDGRALSIAFTVGLLYDPQGKLGGIAAEVRDETARFAEEQSLLKRLAESEEKQRMSAAEALTREP